MLVLPKTLTSLTLRNLEKTNWFVVMGLNHLRFTGCHLSKLNLQYAAPGGNDNLWNIVEAFEPSMVQRVTYFSFDMLCHSEEWVEDLASSLPTMMPHIAHLRLKFSACESFGESIREFLSNFAFHATGWPLQTLSLDFSGFLGMSIFSSQLALSLIFFKDCAHLKELTITATTNLQSDKRKHVIDAIRQVLSQNKGIFKVTFPALWLKNTEEFTEK